MPEFVVYRPVPPDRQLAQPLAPRPASLAGMAVGLLWNAKPYAERYLHRIREGLAARFTGCQFVVWRKPAAAVAMAPEALATLRHCAAVVTAFGD